MSIFSGENDKKGVTRRALPQLLVFLALAGLSALALWPLQRAIYRETANIRDNIIGTAELLTGLTIRYASIRPNIFGAFDIRNVEISGGGEQTLSMARLRVSWSLWNLIRGNKRVLRSVLVDRPRIHLDLKNGNELFARLSKLAASSNGKLNEDIFALLPDGADLRIRGGQIIARDGPGEYTLGGVHGDLRIRDRQIAADLRFSGGIALPGFSGTNAIEYNTRISGSWFSDTKTGSAVFTVPFVRGSFFKLRPLTLNINFADSLLTVEKSPDTAPWDFFLNYDFGGGGLRSAYRCENFSLGDILTLEGDWKQAAAWLALKGSGEAALERREGGGLSYAVDIAGTAPEASGGASFAVRANGTEKRADIRQFQFFIPSLRARSGVRSFGGGVGYTGSINFSPFAPNGTLIFTDLNFAGEGNINGTLSVGSRENAIEIFSETFDIGSVTLAALDIAINSTDENIGLSASALRFRNIESYTNVRLGTVSLDGAFDYEPRQLSATLRLDSFSAVDLEGLASPFVKERIVPAAADSLLENVLVTTEIFFETDFEHVLYNAPRFVIAMESDSAPGLASTMRNLNLGGIQNAVGLVSISGTDRHFELSEGNFAWSGNFLSINGFADYTNPDDINFSLMTNYRELSYYLEGSVLDRRSLSIQGSYGFEVYISSGDNGSWSGYVQGRDIPVPFQNQIGHLSFLSSLRYETKDFWSVDIDRFDLLDISGSAGNANLQITGDANQDGGRLRRISYSDGKGPLDGSAEFSWQASSGDTEQGEGARDFRGELVLEGEGETYRVTAGYREKRADVSVTGEGMQLGRVSPDVSNALADGELLISWDTSGFFEARLLLESLRARIQDRDLNVSSRITLGAAELSVEDFTLDYADLKGTIPFFRMNLTEGVVATEASLGGHAAGRPLDSLVSLDAQFTPVESWLQLADVLESFNGAVHVHRIQYASLAEFSPFDIVFARANGGFSVSGGPRNMLRVHADSQGNFYGALSAPSLIMGSVTGTISANHIDAYSPDLFIDLGGLWQLLPPEPNFALAGGYASAELAIRGPLGDPEFFGSVRGSSISIQIPLYITEDIRPVPFTASINGNEILLENVPANVGSGGGLVNGWFRFDRWIPNIFELDIVVPSQTPVPFGFDITGFLASGEVHGHLVVEMENLTFDIGGNLFVNNTEIGLNSDELSGAQGQNMFQDAEFPVVVDLEVSTGPSVEFLWPSSNIPILRANPDIGTTVAIFADSLTGQFSLNSDINIRSGEIFYFERSFYIRSGTLNFRENEIRFDPRLSARAEARDRNDDGPVTISMIVDNAPLLSFTARFESIPSLSQTEIFALLGQSLTGTQVDEETGNMQGSFLSSGADLLAQFVVVRQTERLLRRWTHLDMLSFRTQVLQNAFFDMAGLRQTPVDRNVGLGNYFDNTTVFLGKYIGANMFIQSMVALRYDENRMNDRGLRFSNGLSMEWDIGVEFQTPLFDIRWDFVPTHPENWFIDDNSISLLWRKTY